MANIFPVDRYIKILPAQNGNIAVLGNAADGRVGTWMVGFKPSEDFVGAFGVLGRPIIPPAANDLATAWTYQSIPYRRISLNGVASDYALVAVDVGGTADLIQIPANALSIGLLIACTAGSCDVVSWDLNGPSTF